MQLDFDFDLEEGRRQKEQGLLLASLSRPAVLEMARLLAVRIAREQGQVTADDVMRELIREGADPSSLGNAAGSVFRQGFEFTGQWRKSSRISNHARVNRVWRLKMKLAVILGIGLSLLAVGGCRGKQRTAQAPPQFANLNTDSTDYTCGGVVPCASWPMPPLPPPGASFVDATYGTTTWRLASPLTGDQAMSTYPRVQAWNMDSTRMMLIDGQGYASLYDATTTPPTYINRILSDVGVVLPASLDVLWAFTDPKRIYYEPNPSSGHGLELRYLDISACTAQNCNLTSVLVHTFACTSDAIGGDIVAGTLGNQIETGSGAQGGMFDSTDRYFSFTCDKVDSSGRHEIDFIRYDRQTDTVAYQDKWYKACPGQVPTGCAVWSRTGLRRNLLRMNQHPDSRYITVIWQCGSRDAQWARGCGTELYDPSYNYVGVISSANTHQDVGYDIHRVPVWVGIGAGRNNLLDERSISITDLTAVSQTTLTYKAILLPCSYSRQPTCTGTSLGAKSGSSHISMTGSWGSFPGYGLLSTMILAGQAYANGYAPNYPPGTTLGTDVSPGTVTVTPASMTQTAPGVVSTIGTGTAMESVLWTAVTSTTATATFIKPHLSTAPVFCLSCGDTGFGAMENFAVLIDSTAADGSPAMFWRIGRTMAIRDNSYNAEPHTAVNRDFTAIVFGSTWNVDPLSNGPVYAFWTKVGEALPPPTGGITVSPFVVGIYVGGTQPVTAQCAPGPCGGLQWVSSHPSVATVDSSGLVTGIAPGSAIITATMGQATSPGVAVSVQAAPPTRRN